MFHQTPIKTCTLLAVIVGLGAYTLLGGHFARELVIEAAILAMLAIGLDVLAGYGGMISLAHGAILGLGAYGYAVASVKLGMPPVLAVLAAMTVPALFGAAVESRGLEDAGHLLHHGHPRIRADGVCAGVRRALARRR